MFSFARSVTLFPVARGSVGRGPKLFQSYATSHALSNDLVRYHNIGTTHFLMGNFLQAKSSYLKVYQSQKNDHHVNYALACTYYNLKDFQNAHAYFKRAHGLNPNDEVYLANYLKSVYQLLMIDIKQHHYDKAHEYLNVLESHDEYKEFALYQRGYVYLEENKPSDALRVLSSLIKLNPEFKEARMLYYEALADDLVSRHAKNDTDADDVLLRNRNRM